MPSSAIGVKDDRSRRDGRKVVAGAGVGQVVGGDVTALDRRNGPLGGGGDALLELPEVGGQGRLIPDRGGHAARRATLGTRLGKPEDVVDEEQNILSLHVRKYSAPPGRSRPRAPALRRFGHLALDQGGLLDDPEAFISR